MENAEAGTNVWKEVFPRHPHNGKLTDYMQLQND